MAEGWLVPWGQTGEGGLVLHVRAFDCPGPLEAGELPPGHSWGSPRLVRDEIHFHYRGLADQILAFAELYRARQTLLRDAPHYVRHWMSNAIECIAVDEDRRLTKRALLVRALRDPASLFLLQSALHAHGKGVCDGDRSDVEFSLAAEALALPPWCQLAREWQGSIGSSYEQPAISLEPGRTVQDLFGWLAEQANLPTDG